MKFYTRYKNKWGMREGNFMFVLHMFSRNVNTLVTRNVILFDSSKHCKSTWVLKSIYIYINGRYGTYIYMEGIITILITFCFLAFDFCRFCMVIRFFYPCHNGQWPLTSKISWVLNYWYHFHNVFGMTRSLTGDWTLDVPHSMPALYH